MPLDNNQLPYDREATIATLNADITRSTIVSAITEKITIPSMASQAFIIAFSVGAGFLGFLYSPLAPEAFKVLVPFSYFSGMLVAIWYAYAVDAAFQAITKEKDKMAIGEADLYKAGVRKTHWDYTDGRGNALARKTSQVTRDGISIFAIWVIWATLEVIHIFRTLDDKAAGMIIVGSFFVGWIFALIVNMTRSEDRKMRFGMKIWMMLSFVTVAGVVVTAIYRAAPILGIVMPFLKMI